MPSEIAALLFVLLPAAAASGWLLAKRQQASGQSRWSGLRPDYLRGMNYLINEQPDKALEVFVRLAEVDNDTVDTHLALGTLFRRRGEVDRAIRIHQNLIARPALDRAKKHQALYELGYDYLCAGVLDRAESLLKELQHAPEYGDDACRLLLRIYEQEKDWHGALNTAKLLRDRGEPEMAVLMANYYCELAEAARSAGDSKLAREYLAKAVAADWSCVRASLIEAELAIKQQRYQHAIRAYRRVLEQDLRFVTEVIEPMRQCFGRLADFRGEAKMLQALMGRLQNHPSASAGMPLVVPVGDRAQLLESFKAYVANTPDVSGVCEYLKALAQRGFEPSDETMPLVLQGLEKAQSRRDRYLCTHCGFTGKVLHWQCPGCQQWSAMVPKDAVVKLPVTHENAKVGWS